MTKLKQYNINDFKDILSQQAKPSEKVYMTKSLGLLRDIHGAYFARTIGKEPVMLKEMRVLMVKKGGVTVTLNLTKRTFSGGALIFLAPDSIVQFESIDDETTEIGFTMSNDVFAAAVGSNVPQAFDGHVRDFIISLSAEEQEMIDRIHLLLYTHARMENSSLQVTMSLFSALLWYVNDVWCRRGEPALQKQSREQRLFTDFIQLVRDNVRKERSVEFYASELCISDRYMSAIISQVSGFGAKKWIDDALIANIKVELKHTNKPVTVVSDEFNFPNTSFFCKYFKRLTGVTPNEYRNL